MQQTNKVHPGENYNKLQFNSLHFKVIFIKVIEIAFDCMLLCFAYDKPSFILVHL